MIAFSLVATRRVGAVLAVALVTGLGIQVLSQGALAQDRKDTSRQTAKDQVSHAVALSEAFKQVT
ncbi:MAG: hypothetical protein IAG10_26105, partial [Planctomycetaceae bacterium]|nr:hypothetical protein [Planctomycetaceae bacterium]